MNRLLSSCALIAALCAPVLATAQDLQTLVDKLRQERDAAGSEPVMALAELKTREAAVALVELYDAMESILMKREVLRALATFDGVAEVEQTALQRLADSATGSPDRELREAALRLLGEAEHMGKHFLALIVESAAEDPVREKAMEYHAARFEEQDAAFYEKLYRDDGAERAKAKRKDKKDKDKQAELVSYPLARIREIALEKIASRLTPEDLVEAATAKERDNQDIRRDGVRRVALTELDQRKDERAIEIARKMYESVDEKPTNRALAADILAKADGAKLAPTFFADAQKDVTVMPAELRLKLADWLAEWVADPKEKSLVGKLEKLLGGKSDMREKEFALRALVKVQDEKITKVIVKLLSSSDVQVQLMAIDALARRGDAAVAPDLEKCAQQTKRDAVKAAVIDALTSLKVLDESWHGRLTQEATSDIAEVRNAALWQLAQKGQRKDFEVFKAALEHAEWSTRLAALKGLEVIGGQDAIGAIIARMEKEEGRMLREFCDALWRMTGQFIPPDAAKWKEWWEKSKSAYRPLETGEFFRLQREEERRRLSQTTRGQSFYGVRIVSHRVIFIIDVSGSMNEAMRSPYLGKTGEPRMEVAKRELIKCIDALNAAALFNVVVFSDGVDRWLDEGVSESQGKDKKEAQEYVEKLAANGGTNLYGALETAFADPEVDTIYVMSDGEPSVGEVIDQTEIRARVQQWNEHRKVVIHTIAVGGTFQVLEWLAGDTGGTHVKYN